MSRITDNSLEAVQHNTYYDKFWLDYGHDIPYVDLLRVNFLTASIREFVGSNDLHILDLGCGRGWMAPMLSKLGKVTGVDFSPNVIKFAREQYGQFANFVVADPNMPKLGLPDNSKFDVVVCSEVLEHVDDHSSLLNQIREFLRVGGWCMLTTPNGNVWPEFVLKTPPQVLQPVENWVTTNQLESLFHASGYRILRHEGRVVYRLSNLGRITLLYREFEKMLKFI